MDKSINKLITSVIITVLLVIISIPIWNYSSSHRASLIANTYLDRSIMIDLGDFNELVAIEDNRAFDFIKPSKIAFRNQNDFSREFYILFGISKESTIDYKYVRVSLNDHIFKMADVKMEEDNKNYYFYLKTDNLDAYDEKEYNARIWLDGNIDNITDTSTLISNFYVK